MIRRVWLIVLLAAFQAAFAVSGNAGLLRKSGFDKLDSGDCGGAVRQLLSARSEGDTSNIVMLGLARALECDNRLVDALSATFADNKLDTTGYIDLLLFRAQLLRKVGLGDEAEKVEAQIAREAIAADSGASSREHLADPWIWTWGVNASTGWVYEGDAGRTADSLAFYSEKSKGSLEDVSTSMPDSVIISGAQIPAGGSVELDFMKGRYTLAAMAPGQVILGPSMKEWLAASGGLRLYSSFAWTDRISTDLGLSASRTWYPVQGADPMHRSEYAANLSNKIQLGAFGLAQANSVIRSTGYSDEFTGYSGTHSVSGGWSLPWRINVALNGGYGWFWDGSAADALSMASTVVMIDNGRVGVATQKDTSLHFLDTTGTRIDPSKLNALKQGMAAIGKFPGQWSTTERFEIPFAVGAGWTRWNGGFGIVHKPVDRLTLSGNFDLARTGWSSDNPGVFQSLDTIIESYKRDGVLYFYRDVATGQDYWVKNPANSKLSRLFFRVGPRVDWTTTIALAATWVVRKHLSMALGWTSVVNTSNLEPYIAGSSYTRSIWNTSASVGW